MSSARPSAAPGASTAPKSAFEQQRAILVGEIASALENVLQNMNKLNRSLEGVIAVGDEFGSVEALWSQFEGVMAREGEDGEGLKDREGEAEEGDGEEDDQTIRQDEKV